jgi:hypothetical protein
MKNGGPNQVNTMDAPTMVFVSWPKITLLKVLYKKMDCNDVNFT